MVDFNRLLTEEALPLPTDPTEVFRTLKRSARYEYLRDVQDEVLRAWHARRAERDAVVKMNTGSGKTLVGLLMQQSLLNEGGGPALYLCPTRQLVQQVVQEAGEVGISTVTAGERAELPAEFLNRNAVLVTTFQKLFNGRSVFGVPGSGRPPIELGSVLVDDAHSCLGIARETVTITLPAGSDGYKRLFALFRSALEAQSVGKTAEIMQNSPRVSMPVPYWAWLDAQAEVADVLARLREDDPVKFAWDLLKDDLRLCHCFIAGHRLQITPHLVPIEAVPSFTNAGKRFFLSATLVDDSILLKEFGVSEQAVKVPIRPRLRGDIGERMILAPSLIHPRLGKEMPAIAAGLARDGYNVVVIVPSFKSGEGWVTAGATMPQGEDVARQVERLRTSRGNFVVFANRYDGIDLPDDACRVLILDGTPLGESLYDRHLSEVRSGSLLLFGRVGQTIEQGLGRGVRSGRDYCVVLLNGESLVQFISLKERLNLFSPETRQQIAIGQDIAKRSREDAGSGPAKLTHLMEKCLDADAGWKRYHALKMTGLQQVPPDPARLKLAAAERAAAVRFRAGSASEAAAIIQDELADPYVQAPADQGWYLQLAANYMHAVDPGRAQEMQRKAHELNRYLLRPLAGVQYQKVIGRRGLQAERVLAWVQRHTEPNAIPVAIESLLAGISFGVDHERFEQAWAELGRVLGFASQRPEAEYGRGPDALWGMTDDSYLLAEAKNEVVEGRTEVHQSEAEQLSNSANWFRHEYGDVPVMVALIHPASRLADRAFPPEGAVVLTATGLSKLHARLRAFAAALATKVPGAWNAADIGQLLTQHRLDPAAIRQDYFSALKRPS